jgi:hypoxanthine phosphoribosyltransferase
MNSHESLHNLFSDAECIYTLAEVEQALARLIPQIERDFADKHPVVLGVMNGSLPTLGFLLPRLSFLLEVDYVHATRYRGETQGSHLLWKRKPEVSLAGRHILLVDDILDQGVTLKAIADFCREQGALSVAIAALGVKQLLNYESPISADYAALMIPDRFVFGYGMDYQNYWRNAPGIYAMKLSSPE